jgi:MoxR-like ATPase
MTPMLTPAAVANLVDQAARVYVDTSIMRYITAVVAATRTADGVTLGVSQRGAIALLRTARTLAASRSRHFVVPDDVKSLAEPVLAHRISIDPEAEYGGLTAAAVVRDVLQRVPPPRGQA